MKKTELDDACASEITATKYELLNAAARLTELQPNSDTFMLRGTVDGRTLVLRIAVGDSDAGR